MYKYIWWLVRVTSVVAFSFLPKHFGMSRRPISGTLLFCCGNFAPFNFINDLVERMVLKLSFYCRSQWRRLDSHYTFGFLTMLYFSGWTKLCNRNSPIPLSMFQFPGLHWSHRRPITLGRQGHWPSRRSHSISPDVVGSLPRRWQSQAKNQRKCFF